MATQAQARNPEVPADTVASRLREAMSQFATGVTVITAATADGRLYGMTANAVTSVSLEPPLILVCLRNESRTLAAVREIGAFAVTMLAHQQLGLASRFANDRDGGEWETVPHHRGAYRGSPLLYEGLTSLECEIHRIDDGGDHRIVIGRVLAVTNHRREEEPLVFFGSAFRRLAAGSRPTPRARLGDPTRTSFQVHDGCVLGHALGGLWCSCLADTDPLPFEATTEILAHA